MSRRSLQRRTWQSDECHARSARVTVRQLQTPVLPSCSGQVALPWPMQALRGSCAPPPMCNPLCAVLAGAANAGIPLSIIVKNYGWTHYFCALLISCGMAILLLAPMVNLKSYVQREAARQKKMA